MSFVNPLGNLGHATGSLPDLTAGIQALQKVEVNRRLSEIQQNRAWERDDRLRNEKETLEMMDIPKADFVTKTEIDKFAKGQQDYTQFITDLNKQKKGKLDINDKIAIMQKKNELVGTVMRGKAFRDSFTEYQKNIIGTRSKLKDPSALAEFDAQQATLSKKMADPNYEPSAYDLIEAQQVPEPSTNIVFAETAKSLLPFVDSSVKSVGGGRTAVDADKLKSAIMVNVGQDDYLFSKGKEEGRWNTKEEMVNQLAERIAPSIKTDVTGWKPTEPTEKEQVEGFQGRMRSSVNEGEVTDAYVFTKGGSITGSYTPEGSTKPTNAKVRPIGIRSDGKLEAEFTIDRETITAPMEKDAAIELKDEVGGKISAPDKNGNYTVIYTRPVKETAIIPLSEDIAAKIRRADSGAAKYLDDLDPYPKRTGAKAAGGYKPTNKPLVVKQGGVTFKLNTKTGEYEPTR